MTASEKMILKAYLHLPTRSLLKHQFELEEDYIAGVVERFLKGERYSQSIVAFTEEQLDVITMLISRNINNDDGKDLLTALLLTKAVCNILNKYRTDRTNAPEQY